MKKVWLNDKQPDAEGNYVLEIRNNEGRLISTFRGPMDQLAEDLADAQVNANRKLGRLLKPDTGREVFTAEPHELDAGDRLRLASEINDPNRVVEAVTEIVTAAQGAPPAAVTRKFAQMDQQAAEQYYLGEAQAFMQDYPEYYPIEENQIALIEGLKARRWDITRNNLAIIFNQLLAQAKMIPWPGDMAPQEEPPAVPVAVAPPATPAPAPRNISTTLRNTDANGQKPAPRPRTPLVTRAQIEQMSRAEYNERLRDPVFRRAVDALA